MKLLSLIFVGCACLVQSANADVIFDIQDVSMITPGDLVKVGVFLQTTDGETVSSYNLPVDFGSNSFGLPTGIASISVSVDPGDDPIGSVNMTGTNMLPAGFGFVQNYDGVVNDVLGTATTYPSVNRLFTLNVQTTLAFTGTVPISITSGNNPVQFNVDSSNAPLGGFTAATGPGNGLVVRGGSISAVPEPGSLAIFGVMAGSFMIRRRRR